MSDRAPAEAGRIYLREEHWATNSKSMKKGDLEGGANSDKSEKEERVRSKLPPLGRIKGGPHGRERLLKKLPQ